MTVPLVVNLGQVTEMKSLLSEVLVVSPENRDIHREIDIRRTRSCRVEREIGQ